MPGLLAAGETTGIGGVDLARVEGIVAGAAAVEECGGQPALSASAIARATRDVGRLRGFADALHATFPVRDGWRDDVAEGTIVRWLKNVGDSVDRDEPIFEITTDKVDVEIPSPATGVLATIAAGPGAAVEVGQLLGEITSVGASAPAAAAPGGAGSYGSPAPDAPATLVPIQWPDMESVTEGTVVEWKKAVGEAVAAVVRLAKSVMSSNRS